MSPRQNRVKTRTLRQDPRRLRRRRELAGLSLRQLGDRTGLNFNHLSTLENGRHSANPSTLAKIALAVGCEISDLMPREPNGEAA